MAKAILICGKLCSGKTTYAKELVRCRNAVLLSVDEITLLFGQHLGDKHNEVVDKTKRFLFKKAAELLFHGVSVVLDWGFWQSSERQEASAFFRDSGYEVEWHCVDADEQTLNSNLKKRNNTDNGNNEFYFIDHETAKYFWTLFEPPKRNEIDFWHHNDWITAL